MRGAIVRASILVAACATGVAFAAQPEQSSPNDAAAILKALNDIVTTHNYRPPGPRLELAAEGLIVRKDADGSVFRFRLGDIGEMAIDREGEAHVLLPCKDGARCVEKQVSPSASVEQIDMVVFSIYPAERGADVLRLFQGLQAALSARQACGT